MTLPPLKLLLTSVGSLLGQNMLDALETRRFRAHVAGTNTVAQNPRNYRCDVVYLVPPTNQAVLFEETLLAILEIEKPDLILAGRDEDVVFLAEFKEKYPAWRQAVAYGSARAARIMQDKWESYGFARQHQLPFAKTLLYSPESERALLEDFIQTVKFPLIAKPRQGFGSNGIYVVTEWEQIARLVASGSLLLQEYLGDPCNLERHRQAYALAMPLFFQIPETTQYACQAIISPSGQLSEIFCSRNTMVMGRCEYTEVIHEPELFTLTERYASALSAYGWEGPLNLQCKPDCQGQWKVFELNPRMSGSTSARLCLGYDEMGILMSFFLPKMVFPNLTVADKPQGVVIRSLTDDFVAHSWVRTLETERVWKKSC